VTNFLVSKAKPQDSEQEIFGASWKRAELTEARFRDRSNGLGDGLLKPYHRDSFIEIL
jgi:hypothetical protein